MFSRDLGSDAFPFEVPPPVTFERTSYPGTITWERTQAVARWLRGRAGQLKLHTESAIGAFHGGKAQ